MQINIITQVTGGHILLYVINSSAVTILTLTDKDQNSIMLVPGQTYRFEWHTWGPGDAEYAIDATVVPANPGFPDFHFDKKYTGPNTDMGGFYFTV